MLITCYEISVTRRKATMTWIMNPHRARRLDPTRGARPLSLRFTELLPYCGAALLCITDVHRDFGGCQKDLLFRIIMVTLT